MSSSSGIYRQEAVDHYQRGLQDEGSLLRISPNWTGWMYWVLLSVVGFSLLFLCTGRIHEYASGPAVVRAGGRWELTAQAGGIITAIDVQTGDSVTQGQVLVRFFGAEELARLEELDREFQRALLETLRDPARESSRQYLSTLRTQREQARAKLDLRTLRAPRSGTVSDIRVRAGMHLSPGELVLALVAEQPHFFVTALLPGRFGPRLVPGQELRIELIGYQYAHQTCIVQNVASEVIGPSEVRRYLGPEIGDAIGVSGPVVLVEAALAGPFFEADDRTHEYRHAMLGQAEVRVDSETILTSLVPGLKFFTERDV